MIAMSSSQLIS